MFLCSLEGEHWKAQWNPEQKEDCSADYTVQRVDLFRNDMSVRVLHAFLG